MMLCMHMFASKGNLMLHFKKQTDPELANSLLAH